MARKVVIVGGGTAGWLTAAYLARMLSTGTPGGIEITIVESEDIGAIGVGEGTFPSIRKTLRRIGISERTLISEAGATFKQGVLFKNWRNGPATPDEYLHAFQISDLPSGLSLLPYWLLGVAGDVNWEMVNTPQRRVAEAALAPKRLGDPDHSSALAYAYHFDAVEFARILRRKSVETGVRHIVDTVDTVNVDEEGTIQSIVTRKSGAIRGDLYIDCTGFSALLIGRTLGSVFRSCRHQVFPDRAVAIQVPYERPDMPIPSATISTAQPHGWTWDIGLTSRRGVGYVYSSDHCADSRAEALLRDYVGPAGNNIPARFLKFEAGYRPLQWIKNCVSIGLSSGFVEPLEATGIGFIEVAALYLATLFPWDGPLDSGAAQFNRAMSRRYQNAIDFIKLHYVLSKRTDTDFWHDNRSGATVPDDLKDRLEQWRYRFPDFVDVDLSVDVFTPANWQYVLYGMGFKTDLGARARAYRFYDDARKAFADVKREGDYALKMLPSHRDLVTRVGAQGAAPLSLV